MLRLPLITLTVILAAALAAVFGVLYLGSAFIIPFVIFTSLAAAAFFVTTAYSAFSGAPFLPTDRLNVQEMLALAKVKPGDRVVDLGAGDGRILVAAAKLGAEAEGWEISPFLWLAAQVNIRRAGVASLAKVHLGSYWLEQFGRADVVTLFLINTQMRRMEEKLRRELRPGARVVSYIFKFPDWGSTATNGRGAYLYVQGPPEQRFVKDS